VEGGRIKNGLKGMDEREEREGRKGGEKLTDFGPGLHHLWCWSFITLWKINGQNFCMIFV